MILNIHRRGRDRRRLRFLPRVRFLAILPDGTLQGGGDIFGFHRGAELPACSGVHRGAELPACSGRTDHRSLSSTCGDSLISEPSTGTNFEIAATDQIRPIATPPAIPIHALNCIPRLTNSGSHIFRRCNVFTGDRKQRESDDEEARAYLRRRMNCGLINCPLAASRPRGDLPKHVRGHHRPRGRPPVQGGDQPDV
jgi:hypothetical protein